MPDMPNMDTAGVQQPSTEFLDLSAMTPIRQRVSAVDRSMGAQEAADFQSGKIQAPTDAAPPPDLQPQPSRPTDAAVPAPDAFPTDPSSVRKRIGKLYGQWKSEQEKNNDLATRLQAAESRLQEMSGGRPYSNQYGQNPAQPQPQYQPQYQNPQAYNASDVPQPAADTVSRAELQNALREQAQFITAQMQLSTARISARREAEMDFPDVFSNPELAEAVDHIHQSDPYLQQDPKGWYKAAALARGLSPVGPPASGPVSTAAKKTQLSGFGPTIAEGQPQQGNDRATRYLSALTYANKTGRLEDYARARRVQMGAE